MKFTPLPNENILCCPRLHWFFLVCLPLVVLSVAVLLAQSLPAVFPKDQDFVSNFIMAFSGCAVVGYAFIIAYYRQFEAVVTDRRISVRTGILSVRQNDIMTSLQEGVDVRQSIVGRLLGYGTLIINTAGKNVVIPWIREPYKIADLIRSGSR